MFMSLDFPAVKTTAPETLGRTDEAAWEAALALALTPALSSAKPSEAFIAHLGWQLAETARREYRVEPTRGQRWAMAGVVGGILSLAGGVLVWLLWRQRRQPRTGGKADWNGWKSVFRTPHPLKAR